MFRNNTKVDYYDTFCQVVVVFFAFLISLQKIYNYDIWWHLKVGDFMLENFTVPLNDVFSFSTQGADWVNLYWLSDPLFSFVHKITGINGLLIFKSLIIAVAAVSLYRFVARDGVGPFWSAILVIVVLDLSRFRFMLRPLAFQFVGVVFLLWFFYRMENVKHRGALLFVVLLLWNGLHGSAFIAQTVLAFLVIDKLVAYLRSRTSKDFSFLKEALFLLVLSFLALLLNPNGFDLYKMVYGHIFTDVVVGSYGVEEHKALVLQENLLFLGLGVLTALSFLLKRANFRLLTVLLYGSFLILAFGSMRYIALASFVFAGVIGINLRGVRRWDSWLFERIPSTKPISLILLVVLCGGLLLINFQGTRVYEFGLGVNESRYPYAAAERLNEVGLSGNIYNSWRFGGFLLWHVPGAKTFIDGRCLENQLQLYDRFANLSLPEFARYMADNNVKAALVDRKNKREVSYFNEMPGFRLALMDDLSVLFLHKDVDDKNQVATIGRYSYLRLGGYDYEYLLPLAKGPEAEQVEQELLSAIQASPDNFFVNFLLAYFYDVRGDIRAAGQYVMAAAQNPRFAHTHFDVGLRAGKAALQSEQWALAERALRESLGYKESGELYFLLGLALQKQGMLDAAKDSYRQSIDQQENMQVLNNLGFLLVDQKEFEQAYEVFMRVLESGSLQFEEQALYGLVLSSRMMNKDNETSLFMKELSEKYPDSRFIDMLDTFSARK